MNMPAHNLCDLGALSVQPACLPEKQAGRVLVIQVKVPFVDNKLDCGFQLGWADSSFGLFWSTSTWKRSRFRAAA